MATAKDKLTILDGKFEIALMQSQGKFGWKAKVYHTEQIDETTAQALCDDGCPYIKSTAK